MSAAIGAGRDALFTAGLGGRGSDINVAGSAGNGGNGGEIRLNAALNAGRDAVLLAGIGGHGGNTPDLGFGGVGGHGGAITVSAALDAGRHATLAAGAGGNGGFSRSNLVVQSGNGGEGGMLTLGAALSAAGDAMLTAGAGGLGGPAQGSIAAGDPGSTGFMTGTQIDVQAAGNITVQSVVAPTSGAVNLTAGTGISNGAGGAVQVQASQLNLRNTTSGDVLVSNTGNIAFTGGASNVGKAHVVSTAGNITLDSAVNASGAGDAIRLAGVNFTNNAGASALSTPAGRWIVWSNSPQANRFGGLQSGSAALWSTAYNGASPTVSGAGNRFAFTAAQHAGVAIAASDVVKIYGDTLDFSTASLGNGYSLVSLGSGATYGNAFTDAGISVAGITLNGTPVLASSGAAATARRDGGLNGGASYAISINTAGVTAKDSGNNAITLDAPVDGILTVTPRALTGSVTATTRSYDSTTKATIASSNLTGLVNNDTNVSIAAGSAAFSSAHAGNNIALTLGSSNLSGADAVNYVLSGVSGSGNITKAQLNATANSTTRTYDGTTNGNNNGITIAGFVGNEDSSVVNQTGLNFSSQNVRNAGSYTLAASGLAAQNYDIGYTNSSITINQADITISAASDSRTYNGLAASTAAPSATPLGAFDTLTGLSQSFDAANAGNRTLTVNSGYLLNDGNAGKNYNVTLQTASGSISKAQLSATANTTTRTYDGTANGNNSGVTITGFVNNETSSVVNPTHLAFTHQNAQNAGSYALTASGLAADNYDFNYTNGNLSINKAALSITANNDSRTYNGTAYTGGAGVSYNGFVNSETISALGGSLTYGGDSQGSRNAGTYNITPGGLTAQNYDLTFTSGSLTTSKADLTLTAATDSRVYNGLAGSNAAPSAIGIVAGESINATQSFDSANVGSRTLSVNSGYTLSNRQGGNSNNNYNVILQSASGSISKAQLNATANTIIRTYDGTANGNNSGVTITGMVNNEASTVVNQAGLAFTNQAAENAGSYSLAASGLAAQNYDMAYTIGNLTINKADLTITAATDSRVYNGLAGSSAAPSAIGIVAGDSITALSQSFDSANAGARTLSVNSGYQLNDGNSGNNYNITANTASGSISKASLNASAHNVSRTYDGTTNGNSNGVTITGMVNGEASTVVNQTGLAFNNATTRNAGSYALTASGLTAQNYDMAYTSGNLTINKADVTIKASTDSRVYNGLTGSQAAPSATGIVAGDSFTAAQSFDSANAGDRTLSVNSGYTLNDGNSGKNYNVALQSASGSISKAALTVSANDASRTYNGTNYSGVNNTGGAGVSYTGFVNAETATVLGGSLTYGGTAQGSRNAGIFSITAAGYTASNYDISYTAGSLTTNKANLTISAATDSRVYNGLAGSNTAPSAMNLGLGDSFSATQSFDSANAGARTLNVNSGYTVNDGNGGNNYNVNLQNANGTITPASLTIQANNASMLQGQTVPLLTAAYLGLVGNDTPATFGTPALLNTAAGSNSGQGTYPITPSGASSPNYIVSYVNGQLTISLVPLPPVILQPDGGSGSGSGSGAGAGAGAGSGGGSGGGSNSQGSSSNSASSFSFETQEQQNARLAKSGQLFTIVDGGVKQ